MNCVMTERRRIGFLAAAAGGVMLAVAPSAVAQYKSNFESLTAGIVTGQDGYYLPNATSADYTVETYSPCMGACDFDLTGGPGLCDIFDFLAFQDGFVAGEPCSCDIDPTGLPGVCNIFDFLQFQDDFVSGKAGGVPVNPTGGNQYIKGVGPAGDFFARAQRDITWPTGVVTASYDVLCDTTAAGFTNNLGSFSMQDSTTSSGLIHLFRWAGAGPDWEVAMIAFDSAGGAFTAPPLGPEFTNLATNKWYRLSVTVDFTSNMITESSITDIETGTTTTMPVVDLFLRGGSAAPAPAPTGFRFFAGANVAGNSVSWDNASIR